MEEPQHHGGQVIQATADISTLNGLLAADSASYAITDRVYESLVDISPIDARPVPELADWWELAPTASPTPFTSSQLPAGTTGPTSPPPDVVFSFDAALDPETGFPGQPDLAAAIASYRAVGDDTVEMTSNGVLADFLWVIRYVVILPSTSGKVCRYAEWVSDPAAPVRI